MPSQNLGKRRKLLPAVGIWDHINAVVDILHGVVSTGLGILEPVEIFDSQRAHHGCLLFNLLFSRCCGSFRQRFKMAVECCLGSLVRVRKWLWTCATSNSRVSTGVQHGTWKRHGWVVNEITANWCIHAIIIFAFGGLKQPSLHTRGWHSTETCGMGGKPSQILWTWSWLQYGDNVHYRPGNTNRYLPGKICAGITPTENLMFYSESPGTVNCKCLKLAKILKSRRLMTRYITVILKTPPSVKFHHYKLEAWFCSKSLGKGNFAIPGYKITTRMIIRTNTVGPPLALGGSVKER